MISSAGGGGPVSLPLGGAGETLAAKTACSSRWSDHAEETAVATAITPGMASTGAVSIAARRAV